ncbi:hydantoinase/oxoprolinase family protein [Thermodesulfobacteriota bacterium]
MSIKIGIDSGGTFTDAVLITEEGQLKITKTPSTPNDPSEGVYNALMKIIKQGGSSCGDVSTLIHGTTVATNALLEYKGVKMGLLLTKGFKDILSIIRQDRPKMYDFFERRPPPLVPRQLRFEIEERMNFDGSVFKKLPEDQIVKVIHGLKASNIRAVAVCFLHSYANPIHEIRTKELFSQHYPEANLSLSCDILPEIREYERMSTTTVNAYVMPIIERYIKKLKSRMMDGGFSVELNIMQSSGGIMPADSVSRKSVSTILSGPAGGVLGSQFLAKMADISNLITFDIGGTSTDICLIADNKYLTTKESEIGGHAIKVPMIDINTIGAGGGSIAWIDSGGALRVGPQSAGADPGPVCYGRGGIEPTVTDANLVLGRLNPENYVGGEMTLNKKMAEEIISQKISSLLGLDMELAAEGILKVMIANMVRGVRRVSVERGYDPRSFTLMAFGGAGPLHACELSEEMNIPQVIIPPTPGVNSAMGLLIADFRYDFSKTYIRKCSSIDLPELASYLDGLESKARQRMLLEKIPEDQIIFFQSADMRYLGQGYEIEIPFSGRIDTPQEFKRIVQKFHDAHKYAYGFCHPKDEVEIIYLRLAAVKKVSKPKFNKYEMGPPDASAALSGQRNVFIKGKFLDTRIYNRSKLNAGHEILGPAILEQFDSTTMILPGHVCRVDENLNLIISNQGNS